MSANITALHERPTHPQPRVVGTSRIAAAELPSGDIDRSACPALRHTWLDAIQHGCRCPDALFERRRYRAACEQRQMAVWVDSVGAARRLRGLACRGYSVQDVAEVAKLHARHVEKIRRGAVERITAMTFRAVIAACDELVARGSRRSLAVVVAHRNGWYPLDAWAAHTIDDPECPPYLGARRGLAAAAVAGWTLDAIAGRACGLDVADLIGLWCGRPQRPGVAAAFAALYQEIEDVPGPSAECRRWAAQVGFRPAAAWEDINDPADRGEVPAAGSEVADDVDWVILLQLDDGLRQAGPWSPAQRDQLVAYLAARGRSALRTAELINVSVRTVERSRAAQRIRVGMVPSGAPNPYPQSP